MTEPEISIGIVSGLQIKFALNNNYLAKGEVCSGPQEVAFDEGGILWRGNVYRELTFVPQTGSGTFSLYDVTIGINFHWQQQEMQTFEGSLKLIVEEERITAVNLLPAEEYLVSVISSEMNANSPIEFLKAQAIVSRSWLFAQMERGRKSAQGSGFFSFANTQDEHIRWYDREQHTNFDFCADDHCQRYQGVTKAISENARLAVKETRGQLLMYEKEICDARFSKCCGGITEEYEYCWEQTHHPYLEATGDYADEGRRLPDMSDETAVRRWIEEPGEAFCNPAERGILSRVLNQYDLQTDDFFRWTRHYTQKEMQEIIRQKSKSDFGFIIDLVPVERGRSGRLSKLKIVGSLQTLTIGKELEIRRILSPTHLYSSAFVIDKDAPERGFPAGFTLRGAGWGHGVGLCQIGAAVMAEQGYSYQQILAHYYHKADIRRFY